MSQIDNLDGTLLALGAVAALGLGATLASGRGSASWGHVDLVGPHTVDLKWSAWSSDRADWEYRGFAKVYDAMQAAFERRWVEPVVVVYTSGRDTDRVGSITVVAGGAHGSFHSEWDDPHALASNLSEEEGSIDRLADQIGNWFAGRHGFAGEDPIAAQVTFNLTANSFPELMEAVDAQEEALIAATAQAEVAFDAFAKQISRRPTLADAAQQRRLT